MDRKKKISVTIKRLIPSDRQCCTIRVCSPICVLSVVTSLNQRHIPHIVLNRPSISRIFPLEILLNQRTAPISIANTAQAVSRGHGEDAVI